MLSETYCLCIRFVWSSSPLCCLSVFRDVSVSHRLRGEAIAGRAADDRPPDSPLHEYDSAGESSVASRSYPPAASAFTSAGPSRSGAESRSAPPAPNIGSVGHAAVPLILNQAGMRAERAAMGCTGGSFLLFRLQVAITVARRTQKDPLSFEKRTRQLLTVRCMIGSTTWSSGRRIRKTSVRT